MGFDEFYDIYTSVSKNTRTEILKIVDILLALDGVPGTGLECPDISTLLHCQIRIPASAEQESQGVL